MAAVTALRGRLPETARHGVAGEAAPARRDIALVAALVEDHRLAPVAAPLRAQLQTRILDAGMRAPSAAVLILIAAVVDGAQMAEGVVLAENSRIAIPIGCGLGLQQIEFVGQRPPHIPVRAETRNHVAEIAVVDCSGHRLVAPLVVGMKKDQIGLDADAAQCKDEAVEMLEVGDIEGGVVIYLTAAREGILRRFLAIVLVPLGEQTHAELIEWRSRKRFESLALRVFRLKGPRVTGRSAFDVRRAVSIGEVKAIAHGDGAAITVLRRDAREDAGLRVERGSAAGGRPGPFTQCVGHEADCVLAVAIVEAFDGEGAVHLAEGGRKRNVEEWIAGSGA